MAIATYGLASAPMTRFSTPPAARLAIAARGLPGGFNREGRWVAVGPAGGVPGARDLYAWGGGGGGVCKEM